MLTSFVELEEPSDMYGQGWYVGCLDNEAYDTYYLHDDGEIYDTCAPRYNLYGVELSTGWYKSAIDAYIQSQAYYNKHGLLYPYDMLPGSIGNEKESQVMEFE